MSWLSDDFKLQGNKAFKAGKFAEAIEAYTAALRSATLFGSTSSSNDICATLFSNRCAVLLKLESYQNARNDAQNALKFRPGDEKARFRLATAYFQLRSYQNALDALNPVQNSKTPEIQTLFHQLVTCVKENRFGDYDISNIVDEAKQNPRLPHADYCSTFIELRAGTVGGSKSRGLFATRDIPQGTLLVGSKAIVCVFDDEVGSAEFRRTMSIATQNRGRLANLNIGGVLRQMLLNGCGRAMLDLEGGLNEGVDIDLRRDDVYDYPAPAPNLDMLTPLCLRNSFTVEKAAPDGVVLGVAAFKVPSFFNHSCMPNAVYYHIGDMIFIVSTIDIPSGSEIFIPYVNILSGRSVQERNKELENRQGGFQCHCALCKFEIENPAIANRAVAITKKMCGNLESQGSVGSKKAIKELKKARIELYRLFELPLHEYDSHTVSVVNTETPLRFAFARVVQPILMKLVHFLKATAQREAESVPYVAELQALFNGNLALSLNTLQIPHFSSFLWSYHKRMSNNEAAAVWLEETKRMCLIFGGDKYFERKYQVNSMV